MAEEKLIKRAVFDDRVCTYWLMSGALTLTLTIVGIPLLLLWFPIGRYFTKRYLDRMDCLLTDKAVKVKKGIFVRVEKTIPLGKITDMGMVQGPVMRYFGLHKLTIETAGQSGQGALVSLTGIRNAPAFRETVLNQREQRTEVSDSKPAGESEPQPAKANDLLLEIRDALLRIESKLGSPNNT